MGSTDKPVLLSPATERMRRHRARRRRGLRCVTISLRETEIAALVRKGLIAPQNSNDVAAITRGLHAFLDRALAPSRDA